MSTLRCTLFRFALGASFTWAVNCAVGFASDEGKLPENWAKDLSVEDLTLELHESAGRLAQNLKKPGDFDRFLKNIKAEAHLHAVLAGLMGAHPNAADWKGIAGEIQTNALSIAEAAEAKGAKNYRTAQDAHKKIVELIKKGESGEKNGAGQTASSDWASLGELGHVMKRVDSSYKYLRGKMSSETSFKKEADTVRHQAAMLTVLAEIAPAYRKDEKEFQKLSSAMAAAGRAMVDAAKDRNLDKAKQANTTINATCNDCHKHYRLDQSTGFDF